MNEILEGYKTATEIENLITSFQNLTLPRSQWSHPAHLTVALWYLIHYPESQAIYEIRAAIQRYNQAMNIATTNNSGYHETLTLFWIYLISSYIKAHPPSNDLLEMTNRLITIYGDKNLILNYYSQDLIMSGEARQNWIKPDLQHLD